MQLSNPQKTATLESAASKLKHVSINISVIKSKVCTTVLCGKRDYIFLYNFNNLYMITPFKFWDNLCSTTICLAISVFDTVRVCVRSPEMRKKVKIYPRIRLTGHSPERRETTNRDRFY